MDVVIDFVKKVLFLSLKYNFSITSWGRTFKRNKVLGGVPGSYHLLWCGIDVVFDEGGKSVDFESDASRCGLKALWEEDHYHLQPAEW